jgi:1-pyrroline-5-carboxylate dehydrogenase
VINLVSGDAAMISDIALSHPDLAGVHFTGSTMVFNNMWQTIGANMSRFRSYPRIVGETGGKDFILAHPSADPASLAVAIARGAFEYQGQKCSAASRVYVPKSLWPAVRDRLVAIMEDMRMGDIQDFRNFVGAVIDQKAFRSTSPTRSATPRSSPAATPTIRWATSSNRRSSRPMTRGTACCARRSSAPC